MRRDWEPFKAEYVRGDATLRDLAAKHRLALGSLGRRAAADGWSLERKRYRDNLFQQQSQAIIEKAAKEHAEKYVRDYAARVGNSS